MKEYTISEQFALIGLNGQDSKHSTQTKKAIIYGIEAANIVQNMILEETDNDIPLFEERLTEQVKRIKKLSAKKRKSIEKDMKNILMADGVLTEIPDLLGCDMNYYTANVTIKEYKCDENLYSSITEGTRAVILEPGEIPLETVCLLWLFRECGCMHDIFSISEQEQIEERMVKLSVENPLYRIIWQQEFHSGVINGYISFLNFKRKLFKNPYLEGVNLLFPFFDRRKAIFIDMVLVGTTVADRRKTAIKFLREQGHSCEEIHAGSETFVKIDNGYYRIWPSSRSCKLPIQGVELLPVYK